MTIQWMDYIEMVAEKTGVDLLEVKISKLNGWVLRQHEHAIHKEGNLNWYSFRQRLIEHYSNVPYKYNAMFAYPNLSQGDEEPNAWYLVRAKILLEHIHCTTKLSSIPGVGLGQHVPSQRSDGTTHQEKSSCGTGLLENNAGCLQHHQLHN